MLSVYIPASHLQFELVNPEFNSDKYSRDDIFVTPHYDIEYLFASVMLSNPLFRMELQNLSVENTKRLKNILAFWKEYRKIFSESDIIPIGNRPCGRSFTGFYIKHTDGEYALVFREATNEKCGTLSFSGNAEKAEVLLSNGNVSATVSNGVLTADFESPRTFAFVKFN